jgi:stalled ribosome alternative rescue factor ArfA
MIVSGEGKKEVETGQVKENSILNSVLKSRLFEHQVAV